jgi:ABC-type transport system involved in cytochrome bd biosynthesis fused ATPase/permease subunit
MNIAEWAALGTVAAGAASVGSLVAVAYQLKSLARQTLEQSRQAAASAEAIRVSTYAEVLRSQMEQDRFFAERPDLREKIYGRIIGRGRQRTKQKAAAAAEMFVDGIDLCVMLQPYLPDAMSGLWEQYVGDCLRDSPYLQAFWRQNRGWYDEAVQEFFDRHLDEIGADDASG